LAITPGVVFSFRQGDRHRSPRFTSDSVEALMSTTIWRRGVVAVAITPPGLAGAPSTASSAVDPRRTRQEGRRPEIERAGRLDAEDLPATPRPP